ncbi:uncharacterized protein [Panulirus ornatus]|uniref:uncharacterized protein isoform X2 n=1 Tax=Panulirus ornatus TaxID=150431 RepID=UPI003A896A0B
MIPLIVVPWFSREEWLEVYEDTFSNDIVRWKNARDTMTVWQARFVSAIVKLPQKNYYSSQSLHTLAADIGLPMHLVDLRNEIIHGSGGWEGGETIYKAFETAYEWIKGYYWDVELPRMQVTSITAYDETSPEVWQRLLELIKCYAALVFSRSSPTEEDPLIPRQAYWDLVKILETLYPEDPQYCIEAVVSHLLVPEGSPELMQHFQDSTDHSCGCFFKHSIIVGTCGVIRFLYEMDGSIELLFSCLIKKGHEHSQLVSEWICLLAGAILGLPLSYSCDSDYSYHKLKTYWKIEISWKRVVVELLESEADWATCIATKIMSCPTTGFTESHRKNIEELLLAFKGNNKYHCNKTVKTISKVLKDDTYTVDNIAEVAQEHYEKVHSRVEQLKGSVMFPGTGEIKGSKVLTSVDAPLGVLPHQKDNPLFYKELILHYPD